MHRQSVFREHPRRIHVLEADPDLGLHIPPAELPHAVERAVARLSMFPRLTEWEADADAIDRAGHLGMLIIGGMVARRVALGNRSGLELLGAGDVIRPWVRSEFALVDVNWTVVETLQVVELDRAFAERVAPWPQIAANLSDRILLRARNLAVQLAVTHLVTVEERVLALMWHFAERWGRVTHDGVVIRLGLTHDLLAAAVGASRPPVTTALSALARKDLVHRVDEQTWRLTGSPPESFSELHRRFGSSLRG